MNLSDSDAEILVRMIAAYRKALAEKQEMRERKGAWPNQRCSTCDVTAELHSGSTKKGFCDTFAWGERCFEAADAANRKVQWLVP